MLVGLCVTTAPRAADDVPAEIRDLEKSLNEGSNIGMTSEAEGVEPGEPGGNLKPSERFDRIPLRPRMSDSNWRRWAGPALEKNYKVHRKDSLWSISDRLFGNPYLWPKVWQLNAQFGNPHVVDPGVELLFTPGNPHSAPALAFKSFPGLSANDLPVMTSTRKLSLMEFLDETLRAQILAPHPPFQSFLLDERPEVVGKIPLPEDHGRTFHDVGQGFRAPKLAEGTYTIARIRPEPEAHAFRVRWVGDLEVKDKRAVVKRAFTEVAEGDLILSRRFVLSPLALHEERVGAEDRDQTYFVPLQEGFESLVSSYMLIGLRFASVDRGPRPGALLTVIQGERKIGTVLVVDRDKRVGTAWIVESERELDIDHDDLD